MNARGTARGEEKKKKAREGGNKSTQKSRWNVHRAGQLRPL